MGGGKVLDLHNNERETMPSERVKLRLEMLREREDKIFAERDKIENAISEIAGVKLNGTQMLLLRSHFEHLEKCDKTIENIHEERYELNQAV